MTRRRELGTVTRPAYDTRGVYRRRTDLLEKAMTGLAFRARTAPTAQPGAPVAPGGYTPQVRYCSSTLPATAG